jgi:hypothetical protein
MPEGQAKELPRLSYTLDEAALVTGLARTRLFQAVRDGRLTVRKDGKSTVVLVDELTAYLKALPTKGKQPEQASAA